MASKSSDEGFDRRLYKPGKDSDFSSPDELITFAQGYFASDFPNPEGLNCPIKGTLSGFGRSGKLPDNRIRSHMFGCSECFGEYHGALAAYRTETESVAAQSHLDSWWTKVVAAPTLKPVPVFACALLLIILAFVGLVFVGGYVLREDRPLQFVAERDSAPAVAPPENPSNNGLPSATERASRSPVRAVDHITRQPFPKQANQQKAVPHPHAPSTERELIAMSIDLGNYAVTRGGADSGDEIRLSRRRTRLLLKLPEGSAKGFYTVSVVNTSGKTSQARRVRSTNGKTLAATINMQRLTAEKYTLRVSREGEPPIDVPIVVLPTSR